MWNGNLNAQMKFLFWITIANFLAQVPYFFRLYFHGFSDLLRLFNIPMILVFALFIIAYNLLVRHKKIGYWLMIIFLSMEFVFYLLNAIGEVVNGFGLFFHLSNPDLILRMVFAIGYLNLFASGYFLFLLIYKKLTFVTEVE